MILDLIRFLRKKILFYRLSKNGLIIGKDTEIQNKISDFGSEPYLIRIGHHCMITSGVQFITHDGGTRVFRDNPEYSHVNKYGNIIIKDNVFIGLNSIIMPNVTIGPNSVVGAGTVVRRNIPPNVCVAGNPARVVCTLEEYIKNCLQGIIQFPENYTNKREVLEKYFWGDGANNN